MEIKLSKKYLKIIADYIESGKFSDACDVVEEALEIMLETEKDREEVWEEFKAKVREGEKDVEHGNYQEFTTMEELLDN